MTMVFDGTNNSARAPLITLAGREFFAPVIALRQARIVVPGLLKIMPKLTKIQQGLAAGDLAEAAVLESEDVELMIDIVHAALTRAQPGLSRDELLDLDASLVELIAALAVVARQSGVFAPSESVAPGEPF